MRQRAFESRVLRKILGHKRNELYDFYCSLNIIRVIRSRRIRSAGHVTDGNRKGAYRVFVGNLKDHLEDPDVQGSTI
jgi:hypothetical protein